MFPEYQIRDFFEQPLPFEAFHIDKLETLNSIPSKIVSPHKHHFHELFYVTEGHAVHNVDFEEFE
ncbi:MAG: hypothetical protein KDC44_15980, partial [Phaeodactylibacter sp.]|nr:hypothetical protein [Phaeodactylibacter sp.]